MTADFWPYGFEPNRAVLQTLHDYLLEQRLIQQKLDLECLFASSTREAFKI
jgi:4,5-dihydroxyphthalate decarboxylase